jgi:cytochrome c peroxidase
MWAQLILAVAFAIPLGLDLYMPVPDDNPLTADKVALGRSLFNDRRLSVDGSISCASCHRAGRAFSDGRATARGVRGRAGVRNTPALINRGYGRSFSWDARHLTLEAQVLAPIEADDEMGSSVGDAAARVGLSPVELASALASYVRSILSGNSRFDRFANGDTTALSATERRGLQVFRGKGNCTACHVGPTLSDERTHNTGVAWRTGVLADIGAGGGAFKTPTLREVGFTAPYMHDGSLASLAAVVDFYDRGGHPNPELDEEIRPLRLAAGEKTALIAFLLTLSGRVTEGPASIRTVSLGPLGYLRSANRSLSGSPRPLN